MYSCPRKVKIKLPTQVTEKHRVFFTFQHMRASRPKVALEPNQTRENLGSLRHQLVMLGCQFCREHFKTEESNLLVGQPTPRSYLFAYYGGLKMTTGPELKWVDRKAFIQSLHQACFHCQHRGPKFSKRHHTVARFLPVILNQLFHILVVTEMKTCH
ncbi:dedicator of cytokinesis protein 10-like isoform X3 [Montipora capricornis]|uniref:dedicator of cytokinesis protein 10-like isoform X3 n=1 Tax=Montipora capricornis TaxID=246305 RepID=UPI0035F15880